MTQNNADYSLAAAELDLIQALLKFQSQCARAIEEGTLTIDDYCGGLEVFLSAYPTVQNTQLKAWLDSMFTSLSDTTKIGGLNVPVFHLLWKYRDFCHRQVAIYSPGGHEEAVWMSFWHTFINGCKVSVDAPDGLPPLGAMIPSPLGNYPGDNAVQLGPCPLHSRPQNWASSIAECLVAWGDAPPTSLVAKEEAMAQRDDVLVIHQAGHDPVSIHFLSKVANGFDLFNKQKAILDELASQTLQFAAETGADIASSQSTSMSAMLTVPTLAAEEYLFRLHSLIAMLTGDAASLALAEKIVNAATNSMEYPNDVFINQLIYMTLLYLGDPLGPYGWNNAQLQTALQNLQSVVLLTDPASVAIKTSLTQHLKVLNVDSAYPLQDPYSNITFTQRQTDTLFALDKARAALRSQIDNPAE